MFQNFKFCLTDIFLKKLVEDVEKNREKWQIWVLKDQCVSLLKDTDIIEKEAQAVLLVNKNTIKKFEGMFLDFNDLVDLFEEVREEALQAKDVSKYPLILRNDLKDILNKFNILPSLEKTIESFIEFLGNEVFTDIEIDKLNHKYAYSVWGKKLIRFMENCPVIEYIKDNEEQYDMFRLLYDKQGCLEYLFKYLYVKNFLKVYGETEEGEELIANIIKDYIPNDPFESTLIDLKSEDFVSHLEWNFDRLYRLPFKFLLPYFMEIKEFRWLFEHNNRYEKTRFVSSYSTLKKDLLNNFHYIFEKHYNDVLKTCKVDVEPMFSRLLSNSDFWNSNDEEFEYLKKTALNLIEKKVSFLVDKYTPSEYRCSPENMDLNPFWINLRYFYAKMKEIFPVKLLYRDHIVNGPFVYNLGLLLEHTFDSFLLTFCSEIKNRKL